MDHLRHITLYDSPKRMIAFLETVLLERYLDRQPDLLSTIYDKLELERPIKLRQLFSSTGQSQDLPPHNVGPDSSAAQANSKAPQACRQLFSSTGQPATLQPSRSAASS